MRTRGTLALACALATPPGVADMVPVADPIDRTFIIAITAMTLTGMPLLPLGPGYGLVETTVTVSQSSDPAKASTLTSAITGTVHSILDTETDLKAVQSVDFALSQTFTLHYEILIEDKPGGASFGGGLASPIQIIPEPLVHTLNASGALDVATFALTADGDTTLTGDKIVHPLGVDLNGNAANELLKIFVGDVTIDDVMIGASAIGGISFDESGIDAGGVDLLALLTHLTADPLTGELSFTSGSVNLSGAVEDTLTDPPFGPLELAGSFETTVVPLPPGLVLLASAVGGLGLLSARTSRRARGA